MSGDNLAWVSSYHFDSSGYPPFGSSDPVGGGGAPVGKHSKKHGKGEAHVSGSGAPVSGSGAPVSKHSKKHGKGGALVSGSGAPVSGSGAPISGSGAPVSGSGAPVSGSGAPVSGSGAPVSGSGAPVSGTKKNQKPKVSFAPPPQLSLGDAVTETGYPVFGSKGKGQKFVPLSYNLNSVAAAIGFDPNVYSAVELASKSTKPSKGKSMTVKRIVKDNPDLAGQIKGPSGKDSDIESIKGDALLDKIARAQHTREQVKGLLRGEKLKPPSYSLNKDSHAAAAAYSQQYLAAIQKASIAASHAGDHGGRGSGRGGRGRGGRGRGSGP